MALDLSCFFVTFGPHLRFVRVSLGGLSSGGRIGSNGTLDQVSVDLLIWEVPENTRAPSGVGSIVCSWWRVVQLFVPKKIKRTTCLPDAAP